MRSARTMRQWEHIILDVNKSEKYFIKTCPEAQVSSSHSPRRLAINAKFCHSAAAATTNSVNVICCYCCCRVATTRDETYIHTHTQIYVYIESMTKMGKKQICAKNYNERSPGQDDFCPGGHAGNSKGSCGKRLTPLPAATR